LIQEISKQKELFCDDYKKEVENKTLMKHMVPGHNRQTYDLTLVVQTETIVFFSGNKIKFCSVVLIFGSRPMVGLVIGYICSNIVQNCTWYNHSIRIQYEYIWAHYGTCILSACFISQGAIFCRNGPHEHADCLALECAMRVFKCLAQAHSNDSTGRCRESHPSIWNRCF